VDGSLPRFVLSGRLFTERFDIVHAGWAMDQPTVGKWLIWFTVLTSVAIPYVGIVRWMSNRSTPFGYWLFTGASVVLSILLLSILSWPVSWLVQYICSMGLTPRRIAGLAYGIAGAIMVLTLLCWTVRRPGGFGAIDNPDSPGTSS